MHIFSDFQAVWLLLAHALSWFGVVHALLTKRDPRSALGWTAAMLFLPVLGLLGYLLLGISRAESRAAKLLHKAAQAQPDYAHPAPPRKHQGTPEQALQLERLGRRLGSQSLCGGNSLRILLNGDMAYPAMLNAIHQARDHVYLATYIFRGGFVGRRFADALAEAAARGVDVRLLVDGFGGSAYSLRKPWKKLSARGVRVARFLPPRLFPPNFSINLRNHRKVLICDNIGFTGGMNIADNHLTRGYRGDVRDVHFRCAGPIVRQLRRSFMLDWGFATGLYDPLPELAETDENPENACLCRVILDGPGSEADTLNDLFCGAVNCARRSVRIMTPYFLPSHDLMSSLRSAALRGVDVRIVLPAYNNLAFVHWASFRLLPTLLEAGVRIWHQPPPFVHSKLFAVDGYYAQIGSANLDARSLRLNFELNMEVFDRTFHDRLAAHIDAAIAAGTEISLESLRSRPLPLKLRDAACWLFSPYL